jgi:hypothetical protein
MILRPCAADVQKATQFLSKKSAATIANRFVKWSSPKNGPSTGEELGPPFIGRYGGIRIRSCVAKLPRDIGSKQIVTLGHRPISMIERAANGPSDAAQEIHATPVSLSSRRFAPAGFSWVFVARRASCWRCPLSRCFWARPMHPTRQV